MANVSGSSELPPGGAQHAVAGGDEVLVPPPVALEGLAVAVEGVAVDLVAADAEVRPREREPGAADDSQQHPLGL